VWWRLLLARLDRRRGDRRAYLASLPVVLEEVSRSLRSGASVVQALGEAAAGGDDPVRGALAQVCDRVASGQELARALDWWRATAPDPAVGLPVAALTLAGDTGGSRAWAVDQVAATLRERRVLHAELRAQSSQAHLSALVLVVAPFAFASVSALVDPRVVVFLVGTPAGWGCLALGVALDAAGAWWMARIVRSPW
jgi:tight adherence protein B